MKKIFVLSLVAIMAFSLLTACGKNGDTNTPSGNSGTTPSASPDNVTSEPTESNASGNSSTTAMPRGSEEWPDNDFTKQIQNPAWDSLYKTSVIADMMFSANYKDISAEQAKEYAEELKDAGFDTDISVNESDVVYSFGAQNGDGYSVGITLTMKKGETAGELLLVVQKS
jgi:predicted small lipoprotein YifL